MLPAPIAIVTDVAGAQIRSILASPGSIGGATEARWAVPRLALVFLVARIVVLACALGVEALAPPDPAGPAGSIRQVTGRPILASLTSWDGVYYLSIAADGYQPGPVNGPYPEVVFFPLYPALVHLAAPLVGGDIPLAGVLVANVAALGGLAAAYGLARARLGPAAALLVTTLVAFQPGAVAFSMAYSDGLFLLLSCGSLLAAGRGSRAGAGLLAMLAALTRPPGVLLVVPLLLVFRRQDGPRPRASWLWALGAPLGTMSFGLAMWHLTGDPLAPVRAQEAWEMGRVPDATAEPWVLAVAGMVYGATALVVARLLWDRWRSGRRESYRPGMAWAVLNVGAIVALRRLQSLPRYLAPLTDAHEQLASGRYRTRAVGMLLGGSVAAYVVFAVLHFSLRLAP